MSAHPGTESNAAVADEEAVPAATEGPADDADERADGLTDIDPAPRIAALARRRSAKWAANPREVLPAWVAEMDFPLAPPVKEALHEAIERDDTGYAMPDRSDLAVVFAGFAGRAWGWRIEPEHVVAITDVVTGIAEMIRVLTDPGDGIAITPPVYHPFFSVIRETGRRTVEAPLREGRDLDVSAIADAFEQGAKVLVLCSPHNPTGHVPTADHHREIAELAVEHDAWVLSDEIWAPLTMTSVEHVPFLSVSDEAAERGIALHSASKAWNIAGLKCAQLVTASETAAAKVAELPGTPRHSGHLGVIAAEAAYRDGAQWLGELTEKLMDNRGRLAERLLQEIPEIRFVPPQAGYLAWLDCRALNLGADPSEAFLRDGRVALSPGPEFGRQGEGFARLNFGTEPELIDEAVRRMARAAALAAPFG